MPIVHKKRDLTRMVVRLSYLKDVHTVSNPEIATFFDTAILCMKMALENRAWSGRPLILKTKLRRAIEAYKSGDLTVADISSQFGMSKNTLHKEARRLGLHRRRKRGVQRQLPLRFKGPQYGTGQD